jgi:tRNA-specific 2-thiouridylase
MSERMRVRAVGMLSGGLDSMLAVRLMLEQGVEVTALHLRTGLSYVERDLALGRESEGGTPAERAAAQLRVPLEVIDVSEAYLPMVLDPRFGYGSGFNPCIDCRIFLLRRAKKWMEEHDHQFVFTGEVLGQRPKSQMRPALEIVERESGLKGYLLRPLSAKLLDPTVPERRGWVDRRQLHGISGRGRKEQIRLAGKLGISEYQQPSGGCCYLIDPSYCRRLSDFLEHEGASALTTAWAELLSVGRHLRLPSLAKLVVGRNERENGYLESCAVEGQLLKTVSHPGPTALLPGEPSQEDVELAARIAAGYSDGRDEPVVGVEFRRADGTTAEVMSVAPIALDSVRPLLV